ncbi:endonuclease/exonuclease/phosphatase family protein [Rhodopseudomonas sp. BR0M22]|uniref:endonuclease/exonuclease/phosphatase family protein n=1 Tax=Rhodopseudomonas sp. BR0M22 TaxID=2269369 RepID=UPI0013E0DD8D|nr:endonuclease/exonuclease/phosphatase family protein [Rhodopseudomonas sp. BR0M22]NEW90756.1 endonuclease/exonuclease/phosphatase family protein [Rhodopseudomonas sp. BR0M22]
MKLASFNVENLFLRARALNNETFAEGREILKAQADINRILGKQRYTTADKSKIIELLDQLGLKNSDDSKFAILRQNRGHLVKRSGGEITVVADGRSDWIGWVDLVVEQVNESATRNTARVIVDIDADVLGVVEAESRPALVRFSNYVLPAVAGKPYDHIMLVDGNDERGIDVGLMTRNKFDILSIVSHVDDADEDGTIFSRDCAQYEVSTANGNRLIVLINHFKSKGFGSFASSNAKRKRQASRVATIYRQIRQQHDYIAIIGDFNDTPDSDPISPLFHQTGLKDISEIPGFDDDGRPGTYKNGTASNKIDYILLSPALFDKATAGGIFRKGVWGGKNGKLFPHYPEITKQAEAASDHAAIWAELDI